MLLSAYNSLENVLQLIGIVIVFLIILAAAYTVSAWVGKTQNNAYRIHDRNIRVIEAFRINGNQFLQIVQIGTRYFALSVTKEQIRVIAELSEEDIHITDISDIQMPFQDVFEKVKSGLGKKKPAKKK